MLNPSAKNTHASSEPSGCGDSDWVIDCWRDMQQRAACGEDVRAEDYLAEAGSPDEAVDVIYGEFILRTQLGETVAAEQFLVRFKDYFEPLRRQFALDGALSSLTVLTEETLDDATPKAAEPPIPAQIGKYTVVAKLSSGGQADVYRAVHSELKQEVVIKLAAAGRNEALHRQQILAEGQILADLEHPQLARIYDVGFDDGRPFLVSRYVRGRTLDEYARQESLDPRATASLMASIARGLAAAHRRGIAHLDVKPPNIVVDDGGQPCLIDFGLAAKRRGFEETSLESGSLRGTLAYMAPEQARGDAEQIGPRCDIFGLGAVLFFLAIGEPPFAIDEFPKMLEAVQRGAWQRDRLEQNQVPPALGRILMKALEPSPENRYQNCDELADALESFARRRTVPRRAVLFAPLAISLAVVCGIWINGWHGAEEITVTPATPPRLTIQVVRAERYVDLVETVPLETGDRLCIRSTIPAGFHATLFLLTSEGELKELCQAEPSTSAVPLQFPPKSGQAVPLTGRPGTEVVFLCVRRESLFTLSDFRQLCADPGPMPHLPMLSVLTADASGIHVQQSDRDFGAPEDVPDPQQVVMDRLNDIRQSLSPDIDFLHAVAFCHVP